MILGIIPARGGSKGLPGKNIADLCGKPVIGYTIEAAKAAKRLNHLVITTDDDNIADVGQRFGVEIIRRPPALAADSTPMPDTIRHAVTTFEQKGKNVDLVVWMQANVPIRSPGMIDEVISMLLASDADSAQTVIESHFPPKRASRLNNGVLEPYFGEYPAAGSNRQDFVAAYFPDGAVVAIRRKALFGAEKPSHIHSHWGKKSLGIPEPEADFGIEIDTPFDFHMAQTVLERRLQLSEAKADPR